MHVLWANTVTTLIHIDQVCIQQSNALLHYDANCHCYSSIVKYSRI